MNTRCIALIVSLFLVGITNAKAQCGMMTGSGGHDHGKASTQKDHGTHAATTDTKAHAFVNDEGMQEATIIIKDGYHPNILVAKKGIPLRLNFDLQEESCTGTVVFKGLNLIKDLNPGEVTVMEFTPSESGDFAFTCPMGMIKGTLEVKE